MPIHKSVGHFQSPARNSERNTAAVHTLPHGCDLSSTPTLTYMYTNFVSSPGTNIRVSFSTIRGHEQSEERCLDSSHRILPLPPSLSPLTPFFSRFPLFTAIFVSGQLISRRRRGTITETDGSRERLAEVGKQRRPGRQFEAAFRRPFRGKENRLETRLVAFLMWPSVQAMNLSCVNRFSSFTFLGIHVFLSPPFPLSFSIPSAHSGCLSLLSVKIPASWRFELSVSRICQSLG